VKQIEKLIKNQSWLENVKQDSQIDEEDEPEEKTSEKLQNE